MLRLCHPREHLWKQAHQRSLASALTHYEICWCKNYDYIYIVVRMRCEGSKHMFDEKQFWFVPKVYVPLKVTCKIYRVILWCIPIAFISLTVKDQENQNVKALKSHSRMNFLTIFLSYINYLEWLSRYWLRYNSQRMTLNDSLCKKLFSKNFDMPDVPDRTHTKELVDSSYWNSFEVMRTT